MSDYTYASGKIRALEPKLLDTTDIERMVDAPDIDTAFKVLNDTDYGDNLLEVTPVNYRQALSDDYLQLYNLLKDLIPDKNLFKLIFIDRDMVNVKLLFKQKYFNIDVTANLKENCVYPSEDFKKYIIDGEVSNLDKDAKKLIDKITAELKEEETPARISTVVTQKYFEFLKILSKKVGNELVNNYVISQIDTANLKILLRGKRLNMDLKTFTDQLIVGGNIEIHDLTTAFEEGIKLIRTQISHYYDEATVMSFDRFLEDDLLYNFEKDLEDYKTKTLDKVKYIAYGPEIILAYHNAKQNAVANIRIIMTGKFNNIEAEEIKKTLRIVR